MKKIAIDILPDGSVRIEPTGYVGSACEKATAEIEKAIGLVKERKRKPEFYQSTTAKQKVVG